MDSDMANCCVLPGGARLTPRKTKTTNKPPVVLKCITKRKGVHRSGLLGSSLFIFFFSPFLIPPVDVFMEEANECVKLYLHVNGIMVIWGIHRYLNRNWVP